MHDVRQRLYKTKVTLLAVIFTVVGLALVLGAAWLAQRPGWEWIDHWPIRDIGLTLFTTGLVAVAFTYVDGKDQEAREAEQFGQAIENKAPVIVQAVLDGLTASSANMVLLSAEQQDQLIRNGLAARLGDHEFATEVYDDIRDQAVRAAERWHDAKISIHLSPLPMGSGSTAGAPETTALQDELFVVTVRWEYSVIPKHEVRRFACVSDKAEYRELAQDASTTSAWYIKPRDDVDAGSRQAFELVQFTVDGAERPIRRSSHKGGQIYSVNVGERAIQAAEPVTVTYTYRTVTAKAGHLLYFDIEQPTRGVDIELDYGEVDVDTVNVIDFIASSRQARVLRTPKSVPGKAVSVEFDGWVFPRSGVAFVWTSPEL